MKFWSGFPLKYCQISLNIYAGQKVSRIFSGNLQIGTLKHSSISKDLVLRKGEKSML